MDSILLYSDNSKAIGVHYQYNPSDKPIGEGGMGVVYKGLCVNERNGSTYPVAIKCLFLNLPEMKSYPGFHSRLFH
jgi:serine/threonine-protein kinase